MTTSLDIFKNWYLSRDLPYKMEPELIIKNSLRENRPNTLSFARSFLKESSDNAAAKNRKYPAAIFLAYLSSGTFNEKKTFQKLFIKSIFSLDELLFFVSYVRKIRGMGHIIHKVVKRWFSSHVVEFLEEEFNKNLVNDDWTAKDILRMFHIKPRNKKENELFKKEVSKNKEDYNV